jgi:two-component system chemotaxis family response regulator WspR
MSPGEYPIIVLLVDDQPIVAEAIRRALVEAGDIRLHFCDEPAAALEYIDEFSPTVILQDLVMPGVDGISLVRRYRAHPRSADIPVIVLSTTEDAVIKSAAFAAGANDYIVKIPDRIELIARIRHHSRAYLNQVQRDQAYVALQESQQRLLESNRELQRLTNLDGLTGLSNRRHADDFLAIEWKRAMREQLSLAVLMIDVDDFKRFNDSYGHLAGDEVLRCVSQAIQFCISRPADLAARFGGEEFIAVLPATAPAGAAVIAERIRSRVEALNLPHRASSCADRITVSIGAASTLPRRGAEPAQLVAAADAALYQAKGAGRNRVGIDQTITENAVASGL